MTDKTHRTAHAEITAPISADLRRKAAGALAAPITYMTEDRACKWAWEQVQQDVGTKGWTAGDSGNFFGFFLWGWNYRGQYETQRPAAPPAPAAVAVPELRLTDEQIEQIEQIEQAIISARDEFMLRETGRTDKKLRLAFGRAVLKAALAAAPAQAVTAPEALINEPVTKQMIDAGAKAAREYMTRTGGNNLTAIYRAMRALAPAGGVSAPPAQEHATQLAGQDGVQDEGLAQVIDERDTAEGWVDGLTRLIGEYFGQDIGEHSSAHNPWQEAKEIIEEAEPYRPAAAPAQAQEDARQAEAIALPAKALEIFGGDAPFSQPARSRAQGPYGPRSHNR